MSTGAPVCQKPEILAPAGNDAMLHAAVCSGAEAVYLGLLQLNARRAAGNFSPAALSEAVRYCHARGVRVYVTLNTILYPADMADAARALEDIAEAGADAVIVQDLAAARLARRIAPGLALHGSTQMSVHSPDGARMLAQLGFSRVILARELALEEIARIADGCGIETEVFVHGALCVCVSGQCYMSAFLGGRSGNRGGCAGPCRLPFDACPDPPAQAHHLSLKDLSILRYLPELAKAGVVSAKIEGRLRSPEYVAAAVHAARQARAGEAYDEGLLRSVFSRSGFTDGYITGRRGADMFGVRTEEDAAAARSAAPKLRELYRREFASVGVSMALTLTESGARLSVSDPEGNCAKAACETPLARGRKSSADGVESCRRSLQKTGGTPFFAEKVTVSGGEWHCPGGVVNELRREALDTLLERRSVPRPLPHISAQKALADIVAEADDFAMGFTSHADPPWPLPGFAARFQHVTQAPPEVANQASALYFPLEEWRAVPQEWRGKTWLAAPRTVFGAAEDEVRRAARESADGGFAGYAAQNIAQFYTFRGLPVAGAFGLNVANDAAVCAYARMGAQMLTLSPELSRAALSALVEKAEIPLLTLAYGYMPVMVTRACPLKNVRTCGDCPGSGNLLDRKGMRFMVRCSGAGSDGVRTVYNPVPLYCGDKPLPGMPLLYFTVESAPRIRKVAALFLARKVFDRPFTRGLYERGAQ